MSVYVSFQLVDVDLVARDIVPAWIDGRPSPRAETLGRARWDAARAQILSAEPADAARVACETVLAVSAASLPRAWVRNLAVTADFLRTEEALAELPRDGFGPSAPLFSALLEVRPELAPWFPSRLEGDGQAGALCRYADIAADALRRFRNGASPEHAARVAPILSALRAAHRHELAVWETSLDCGGLAEGMVWMGAAHGIPWPGLSRWGTDEGPLSAGEWEAVRATTAGDVDDLLDAALAVDPAADLAVTRAICTWIASIDPNHFPLDDDRLRAWLERAPGDAAVWLASRHVLSQHDHPPAPSPAGAEVVAEIARRLEHHDARGGRRQDLGQRAFEALESGAPPSAVASLLGPLLALGRQEPPHIGALELAEHLGAALPDALAAIAGAPSTSDDLHLETTWALLHAAEVALGELEGDDLERRRLELGAAIHAHGPLVAATFLWAFAQGQATQLLTAIEDLAPRDPLFEIVFAELLARGALVDAANVALCIPGGLGAATPRLLALPPSDALVEAVVELSGWLFDDEAWSAWIGPHADALVALLRARGPSAAGELASRLLALGRADLQLELALAWAAEGHEGEASAALARALASDPTLRERALAEPSLAPLLG